MGFLQGSCGGGTDDDKKERRNPRLLQGFDQRRGHRDAQAKDREQDEEKLHRTSGGLKQMALLKMREGNKTIALMSGFIIFVYAYLTLGAFGIMTPKYTLFTPIGAAVLTILGAVMLILETYFEGKQPDFKRDVPTQINTVFAVAMLIFGIYLARGQVNITPVLQGVLGVGYLMTTLLLARELVWD